MSSYNNQSLPSFDFIGKNGSGTLDLNKIFQLNLSYNFDLLKNVLEGLLKAQKDAQDEISDLRKENEDKNEKMNELEQKLLDMHILIQNSVGDSKAAAKLKEAKKELEIAHEKEREIAAAKKKQDEENKRKIVEVQQSQSRTQTQGQGQSQEQDKNQNSSVDSSGGVRPKFVLAKKYVNDGIKLEVSLTNDEITNKIIVSDDIFNLPI